MQRRLTKGLAVFIVALFFTVSVVKTEAMASSPYPSVSSNSYLELVAFRNVNVYTSSALSRRGTSSPWRAYNASISRGDTIYVYKITSGYCYFSYPVGRTRKLAYCRTSDLLGLSQANACFTAKARCTVYRTSTGSSYGSVSKNDIIYTMVKMDNRGFIIYTAKSGKRAWKAGWISLNDVNKIKNTPAPAAVTYYVKTSGPSSSLIMRRAASSTSAKVAYIPYASVVTVYSISNNWAKVTYGGKSGYCNASYLSRTKPAIPNNSTSASKKNLSAALYNSNSAYISCGFDGYRSTSGRHEGIDIKLRNGASVYSLTDGVVVRVAYGYNGSKGLSTIAIYNAAQNKTIIYLHSAPVAGLKAGQTIRKGQRIAAESWRGVSSSGGSHTHVEVRTGRVGYAAKSVNDSVLDNQNPTSFWNAMGYNVK